MRTENPSTWHRMPTAAMMLAALLAFAPACDGEGGGTTPCPPGTQSCECRPDGTCDEGLVCDRGYCVPSDCPDGSEGCPCYANGTCDDLDGVPMSCIGNVCTATVVPDPGTLNGACGPEIPCGTHEGTQLECIGGICQDPSCPSGTLTCPCGPYAACDDVDGESAVCTEDYICALDCAEPGARGCECGEGDTCDAGLECVRGVCWPSGLDVRITDSTVRACDVLLQDGVRRIDTVRFDAQVVGEYLRRGSQVAVSFTVRADATLTTAAEIMLEGDAVATSADIEVVTVECYDRLGQAVAGSPVTLE